MIKCYIQVFQNSFPIIYPNTPTSIDGAINELHPFAPAIPAAVAGPPMLVFDAIIVSSIENLKILVAINDTAILTTTIMPQNTNSKGAFLSISDIDAGIAITNHKDNHKEHSYFLCSFYRREEV